MAKMPFPGATMVFAVLERMFLFIKKGGKNIAVYDKLFIFVQQVLVFYIYFIYNKYVICII